MPTKSELRRKLRVERLTLTEVQVTNYSQSIIQNLRSIIDWNTVATVHYFEPITALNEPNITPFINELAMQGIARLFTTRKIDGQWQVVNRGGTELAAVPQFDVILVPMLGFDPVTKHRIGYGGGYYDRLLASQPRAQTIGVCFAQGAVPNLVSEDHDVSLSQIVTD